MTFRAICVVLAFSSLPIAGCGTVVNLVKLGPEEGGKSAFGGVHQDVWCMRKAANGEFVFRTHADSGVMEQSTQVALMILCTADLPLSLIADVLTWPYVQAYSFINEPVPVPPVLPAPAETRPQMTPPAEPQPKPTKAP
jgi:uncharacterized protein YceK